MLRIALQKSGRLSEDSLKLIAECGINVNIAKGMLMSAADNFNAELIFLRDDDIPGYVADGVADVGIIGENIFYEEEQDIEIIIKLGFSKCRLSLAIPKNIDYKGIEQFNNLNIATSYPNLLKSFLNKNRIAANIHVISGSVEIAPGIGLADAICDLVSSGSTLLTNGLKEVETLLHSEAVLVGNKSLSQDKKVALNDLVFRIKAVQNAKNNKYILLNAPNDKLPDIIAILPGMKSPTIVPLAMKGWSSLHSVINEDKFWELIGQLKKAGAEGILVVPIEKMIL